jgi:hypothetical protein
VRVKNFSPYFQTISGLLREQGFVELPPGGTCDIDSGAAMPGLFGGPGRDLLWSDRSAPARSSQRTTSLGRVGLNCPTQPRQPATAIPRRS